jgi:hypothetical protein
VSSRTASNRDVLDAIAGKRRIHNVRAEVLARPITVAGEEVVSDHPVYQYFTVPE